MTKIAEHDVPRAKLYLIIVLAGLLWGVINGLLDADLTPRPVLFGWLAAAILIVVLAHEGVHGGIARVFGYRPLFGLKPPLIYVTFNEKIPRGKFITIALAPLVILDILFAVLYSAGTLRLFFDLCFIVNTLGSGGDLWITFRLVQYERGVLVQDTKNGIEIWSDLPLKRR